MAIMLPSPPAKTPTTGSTATTSAAPLRSLIQEQDANTGYFQNSMYHHGFAMLALAEAYGTVDDRALWTEKSGGKQRSIGEALELAVRSAITSQKKNSYGAWRYSPSGNDADTSVAGAVLMGLLAARNAGVEVPDEAIDKAISYFVKMTADSGQVAYSGGIRGFDESLARISIGTLVYSIARRKDLPQFKSTLGYLTGQARWRKPRPRRGRVSAVLPGAGPLPGDFAAWEKWNKSLIRQLKTIQMEDGSFKGSYGNSHFDRG